MARLQVLELPTIYRDEGPDETPFVLVIDQASEATAATLGTDEEISNYAAAIGKLRSVSLAEQIGARAVLVFEETIDIPATGQSSNDEEIEVSDADFTEMASVVRRALGIDMTQVGVKPDIAGWLLTSCRELEKSEAARARLRDERAEMAADLKRLRAGEEPVTDSRIVPTPAQWIWQWNRATPEKRLSMAAQILDAMPRANNCLMLDHEARLADLQTEVQRLRTAKPDA
jgi:hypothetical protein